MRKANRFSAKVAPLKESAGDSGRYSFSPGEPAQRNRPPANAVVMHPNPKQTMSNLTLNARLLAIIGRRIPAIYDVIPRGPQSRLAEVALNPQPLPPIDIGAAVAAEFIHAAWLADRTGQNGERIFADLDDWCPTKPKRLKLPPWWPPVPDPEPPHPEWFVAFHLGFAARVAAVAEVSRIGGDSFNKAIDRSLSAIESTLGRK